jgi:hypothetical protein
MKTPELRFSKNLTELADYGVVRQIGCAAIHARLPCKNSRALILHRSIPMSCVASSVYESSTTQNWKNIQETVG